MRGGYLLAVALCFSFTLLPAWSDDHGDTYTTATALTADQVLRGIFIPGNIEESGDLDYFSFVVDPLSVDYQFVIETTIPTSDPFSDTYLRLIAPDGVTPLAMDDDSGGGRESKILWAAPAEGTYFVEVSQAFTEDIGTYSVAVLKAGLSPPDDHGDTPDQATPLIIGDPARAGETELPGDIDFFQFIAQPSFFYDIETSGLNLDSDTVLTLYASDGETVLGMDDQSGRELNASRILWIAPQGLTPPEDVIYLRISQFLPSAQGTYSIRITSPGPPERLKTNSLETNTGFLDQAGDVDAFILAATRSHTTTVDLATTNYPNRFEMNLLDQDGISVLQTASQLDTKDLIASHSETGDYFLLVTEPYIGGPYSLSATDEAPAIRPDVNSDGVVNQLDFLELMRYYQQNVGE